MPWTPEDATSHTSKANTPRLQRMWAHIANQELAAHGDEGRAIRTANGTISDRIRNKAKVEKKK